ncbi:hypothetical protein HOK22_04175, partial [Candidatus Peregrinibacteria bacterium]|nr:hypothetical protein [Candidatus Peregrinibacteria bacterium]
VSKNGVMIRTGVKNVPKRGRATQGVYIMRTKKNDIVASMSFILKEIEEEEVAKESKQTALV